MVLFIIKNSLCPRGNTSSEFCHGGAYHYDDKFQLLLQLLLSLFTDNLCPEAVFGEMGHGDTSRSRTGRLKT